MQHKGFFVLRLTRFNRNINRNTVTQNQDELFAPIFFSLIRFCPDFFQIFKSRAERVMHLTAKEYLNQAYRLNELIDSDLAELNNLRSLSTSISGVSYDTDRVQGGNLPGSRIENIVSKIVALEDEINAEIDRFVDLKVAIRRAISNLPNRNEQLLLRLRYIEFLSWPEVQERMGFEDVRRVHQLHNDALKNFKIPAQ